MTTHSKRALGIAVATLIVWVSMVFAQPPAESTPTLDSVCADVRALIARRASPLELPAMGDALTPNATLSPRFASGQYAHYYVLNVTQANTPITVQFIGVDPALNLETALFLGMDLATPDGYVPLTADGELRIRAPQAALYTLVIRRANVADLSVEGTLTFRAAFSGDNAVTLPDVRDETRGTRLEPQPQLTRGIARLTLPTAQIHTHGGAVTSVGTQGERAARVFFRGGELLVGAWADNISLLGGDLSVTGQSDDGGRLLYIQNYDYRVNAVDENLFSVPLPNGQRLTTDWRVVRGVWLTQECAAFLLRDGRTFEARINPQARGVTFSGTTDAFTIAFTRPDSAAVTIALDWAGVDLEGGARYTDNLLTLDLIGGRRVSVGGVNISARRRISDGQSVTPTTPLDINTESTALTMDWLNISTLSYTPTALTLTFTDAPRGVVTRPAQGLVRFEALQDVVRLVYAGGREDLLLPASDDYLEIITPQNAPAFDSLALPDETGYLPRALNNLGGECHSVNTLLEQANCPPNGHYNPANGNLWYSVTDVSAAGGLFDLVLARSYNLAAANEDSPFGYGWATAFALDYRAPYAPPASAPVSLEDSYRPALDVSHAPRGIVTLRTPSGSRHVFVSDTPDALTFRAPTVRGWTLTRESIRGAWTLTLPDGFTYQYDRAGRLRGYGYPDSRQFVRITHERLSATDSRARAIITDDAALRTLTLEYDAQGRITHAELRDTTRSSAQDACTLENGCLRVVYHYTDGLLTRVDYPDGTRAFYRYDDARRLIEHTDPRAPIAPRMTYTYAEHGLAQVQVMNGAESLVWRSIAPPQVTENTRAVTVTDDYGRTVTYTYALESETAPNVSGAAYTLIAQSSPLAELDTADALPQTYQWTDGLLTQINARVGTDGGRNSTVIRYTESGRVQNISGAYNPFDLVYDAQGRLTEARYADGSTQRWTYADDSRYPVQVSERGGALYDLTWAQGQVSARTRPDDAHTERYAYNSVGLLTEHTRGTYRAAYAYDGLGRVIKVSDTLGTAYTVTYRYDPRGTLNITLTDSANAEHLVIQDALGRVLEQRISAGGDILRRTVYTYDAQGRITRQTQYADAVTPITTRWTYSPRAVLPVPAQSNAASPLINGYAVTHIDPFERAETYTYDAFDRIRLIEDPFGQVTRYDYLYTDTGTTNGLRIVERVQRGAALIREVTYRYSTQWQLTSVSLSNPDAPDNPFVYDFFPQGTSPVTVFMEARRVGIRTVTWDSTAYAAWRGLSVTPELSPLLDSRAASPAEPTLPYEERPAYRLTLQTDTLGRPSTYTNARGIENSAAYVPLPDGGTQIRVTQPDPAAADSPTTPYTVTYDALNRPARVIVEGRGAWSYAYSVDTVAQVYTVTITFDNGHTWVLDYNAAGDLIRWTDAAGITRTYGYDWAGRLTRTAIDGEPEASYTFAYNALNQLTREINDVGRGTLYQYDTRGLLIAQQDIVTSDATTFSYGANGQLTNIVSPLGNTASFLYNDAGDPERLTAVIDLTGVEERFVWDDENKTLTYRDVRGGETRYTFDAFGLLWRVDDALGQRHLLRYDSLGRVTEWRTADARTLDFAHDADTLTVSAGDWAWAFGFDALGTLNRLQTPNGALNFTHDSLGRLTAFTSGQTTALTWEAGAPQVTLRGLTLTYDALDRLREVRDSDGVQTRYTYDIGRRTTITLGISSDVNRKVTYSAGDDSLRRRSVTIDAGAASVTYFYDAEGRLDEVRSSNCAAEDPITCDDSSEVWISSARFVYDALGRPIRIIDEEQNVEAFSYDDTGNLVTYQGPGGRTFTYQYDALNRLTSLIGPTGIRMVFRYDALDNVTGVCRTRSEAPNDYAACVASGGERFALTYDSLGRITAQRFPNVGAPDGQSILNYARDAAGLLRALTVNDADGTPQERATFGYTGDALALLASLTWGTDDGSQAAAFRYDDNGRLVEVRGTTPATYQYDRYGRLDGLRAAGRVLEVLYAEARGGYTVRDVDSDAALTYTVDTRGFLTAMDYAVAFNAAPDAPLLSLRYRLDRFDTSALNVIMSASDGQHALDLQMDRSGDARNLVLNYGDLRLLTDYLTDANGRISRQRIDGTPSEYFVQQAQGYIQALGYNDDGRLATVRISAQGTSDLLYIANFTYNDAGLRASEVRRYADSTLMVMTNEHANGHQLTRRTVTLTRAQGRPQTFVYDYRYDLSGNLTDIISVRDDLPEGENTRACALFGYDSLNRLIRAEFEGRTFVYGYDAHGRLTRANNLTLLYAGDTPLMAVNPAGLTTFYVQTDGKPILFFGEDGRVTWLIGDGRDRVLGVDDGQASPLVLLDPLGRPIPLGQTFPDEVNPCTLTQVNADVFTLAYPQTTLNGMLWHPQANLYFRDGRVYLPEIGQYLQHDPVSGGIYASGYEFSLREPLPVLRRPLAAVQYGLSKLNDSVAALHTTRTTATAEAVKARFMPSFESQGWPTQSAALNNSLLPQLERLAALPHWLTTEYAPRGAGIDAHTQQLTFAQDSAPAQHIAPFTRAPLPHVPLTPQWPTSPSALLDALSVPQVHARDAVPLIAPRVNPLAGLAYRAPQDWRKRTPSAVLAWLPQPLSHPQEAASLLDALAQAARLPSENGALWAERLLRAALPTPPSLPLRDIDALRDTWFPLDAFGLQGITRAESLVPHAPTLPSYPIGSSIDWLLP